MSKALDLAQLPRLEEIFQKLLDGYHICHEDFALYREISEQESEYGKLFAALGYTLKADVRGYYYFVPSKPRVGKISDSSQRAAVLVFVLVETLADQGLDPDTLLRGEPLPESMFEQVMQRHGDLLRQAELNDRDAVDRLLRWMESKGLLSQSGGQTRFRTPIARFLDVCLELAPTSDTDKTQETSA
ncbi:MAG: condensin complex protein MksE [Gammaproteobacteria bacterium]